MTVSSDESSEEDFEAVNRNDDSLGDESVDEIKTEETRSNNGILSQRHAGKERSQDFSGNEDGTPEAAIMPSTNATYKVASIPGDGIGPEVISAAIMVLKKLASIQGKFSLQFDHLPWSSEQYKVHGRYIPEGGLEELRKYDAILFGSVGDPGLALLKLHLNLSQR